MMTVRQTRLAGAAIAILSGVLLSVGPACAFGGERADISELPDVNPPHVVILPAGEERPMGELSDRSDTSAPVGLEGTAGMAPGALTAGRLPELPPPQPPMTVVKPELVPPERRAERVVLPLLPPHLSEEKTD